MVLVVLLVALSPFLPPNPLWTRVFFTATRFSTVALGEAAEVESAPKMALEAAAAAVVLATWQARGASGIHRAVAILQVTVWTTLTAIRGFKHARYRVVHRFVTTLLVSIRTRLTTLRWLTWAREPRIRDAWRCVRPLQEVYCERQCRRCIFRDHIDRSSVGVSFVPLSSACTWRVGFDPLYVSSAVSGADSPGAVCGCATVPMFELQYRTGNNPNTIVDVDSAVLHEEEIR